MELLLNLAWLLVAIVAVAIWLCQSRRGARGAISLCLQSIALVCALAVLFPAISATDDLHAAQLAVDASDAARKMLRSMNTVSSSSVVDRLHFLPALFLLALAIAPRCKVISKAVEAYAPSPQARVFAILESRAPPAVLFA